MTYADPYYFPPPFNLLQLLVRFPSAVLRVYGTSSACLDTVQRLLWRITVGPLVVVAAGLWGWGLRQ